MAILLANIGNRNISFGGKHINKENYYQETKSIFEDLNTWKDEIKVHILDSIVTEYQDIETIYLIVTNQNPPYNQDSYRVGKIIQSLRNDKNIQLIVITHDPRQRDKTFNFFEQTFTQHPERTDNNKLIVSGSGGIPACKEALNFYTVFTAKNPVITDVDENTNQTFTSAVEVEYLKNIDRKIFTEMINHYDYSGAYQFLKHAKIRTPRLEKRIQYLSCRYNFDFLKANALLRDCQWPNDIQEIPYSPKDNTINALLVYKDHMLIELFDNLEVTFRKGEYTMILGKIFSLQENLWTYLFEKTYAIKKDNIEGLRQRGIPIRNNDQGGEFVEIKDLQNELINHRENRNREGEQIEQFCRYLNRFKELRNGSIVAHGFGGTTRDDVQEIITHINDFKTNYLRIQNNTFTKLNTLLLHDC